MTVRASQHVVRVTSASITRQQIHELLSWSRTQPNRLRLERLCQIALDGATAADLRRGTTRRDALARCAVTYNEMRATPEKPQ